VPELERERELLGRLLGGGSALELLMGEMTSEQFSSPTHAMIWEAMARIFRRGARVDTESVICELGEAVATVGGPEEIRAIARDRVATEVDAGGKTTWAQDKLDSKASSPSNPQAERATLGALLTDSKCADLVMLEVTAEDFAVPAHAIVFDAIQRLVCRSNPVDAVLVSSEMDRIGKLDAVGGYKAIASLVTGLETSANALYYAHLVRDAAQLRAARRALETGLRRIAEGKADADAILAQAEHEVFLARRQARRREVAGVGAVLRETFAELERVRVNGVASLAWGYPSLDDLTHGLHKGDLVVVASRPGLGKTTFAANVLRNVCVGRPGAAAGRGAVFFSIEMPRQQLVLTLLCSMAKVDSHRMRGGFLSREEETSVIDWGEVLERAPIYVDDTAGLSIPELRTKARRLKLEGKIECVFVDYLQLMRSGNPNEQRPRHEIVAEISGSLKALARELDLPVVALAQLNRDVEDRPDHRPRLRDLRESGSIEVDADVVVFVHRDEYYMTKEMAEAEGKVNRAQVIVAKNRNGPTGDVELYYAKEFSYFGELER
jgi:replicative DNA helicase